MSVIIDASDRRVVLENGLVRLELTLGEQGLSERIYGWNGDWVEILSTARPIGDLVLDHIPVAGKINVDRAVPEEGRVSLEGEEEGRRYRLTVTLRIGERHARYKVDETIDQPMSSRSLMSRYAFAEKRVDFSFGSHLRPAAGQVIGQFAFKSPALIVQKGPLLASLVADVDLIGAKADQLLCLEPDASNFDDRETTLGYGFKDHEPHGLIYFQHRDDMIATISPGTRSYGYLLYVSSEAEPLYGYREIVRLLWSTFGQVSYEATHPQVISFDKYADYALDYALPNLWRDIPVEGTDCGGMLMGIKFPNDIWFHFFFNHLHTAFGLYRMGKRRGRPDLVDKARKIRNLILSAPRLNGAIPAIFSHQIINGIRQDEWIPHAHWVGGSIPYQTQIPRPPDQPAYSTMDGAWTSYWMLRWAEELEADARLIDIAREYGELLLSVQTPSGSVPVWLDKTTLEPFLMLRESPSSAASGVLFAKLYEVTKDARFLNAAKRVAAYLESRHMPQGWTDYECFFDSAGKPVDLSDPYSGQRPQCTFPIFWTSQLAKELYRSTGEKAYLDQALRAVDYLVLFQGVWSPPYLTVKGFGSIGIGNGHTGWNDARSGIFAPFIADFYALTGNPEYLQRAAAAMRSPLALMYIPENEPVSSVFDKGPTGYGDECYAHRGRDARLGPSTFDFSIGYALMAYEEIHINYGAAYVDKERGHKIGIDGCSVDLGAKTDSGADFTVIDKVGKGRLLEVVVGQASGADGRKRQVRVEIRT
ncbi:hypothetical protein [Shinella sp.]|uniref:hypothetical protein n=1 Tax=Shinella sp. TaxID=1870904 RepID=UPI00289DA4FB|nr:hypothetical protein [Shinella sp.]